MGKLFDGTQTGTTEAIAVAIKAALRLSVEFYRTIQACYID
ncbi:MAG: hypothetical protein SGJ27_29080 [Candidatus Melainabacteria bacterium]|nr:hypothetical protein [Candidatus Melainabacteria bacterium]